MFTLINYLKSYEKNLSDTEISETQYLNRDTYSTEEFNLNSLSKIIMSKIKETSNLINLLNKNISDIKNEILTQINSNFNNHIILISKIQTVDYLIENIETPLNNVKQKLQNNIDSVAKNEEEIKSLLQFFIENDKILHNSKMSFTYYKLIKQANTLKTQLEKKKESTVIKNLLDSNANENLTLISCYDYLKNFLIEMFRLLTLNQKIKDITDELKSNLNTEKIKMNSNNDKDDNVSINEIEQKNSSSLHNIFSVENAVSLYNNIILEDESRFIFLEKILEICLNEIDIKIKENCQRESLMYRNLLDILFKCYNSQNKLIDFFDKVKVAYFIMEINDIFSKDNFSSSSNNLNKENNSNKTISSFNKSNSLEKKLKSFENLLNIKYKFMLEICKEHFYKFNLFCIVAPLLNKLSTEKHLFNCIDAENFRNNINSIYFFIEKFPIRKIYSLKLFEINSTNKSAINLLDNEDKEKENIYISSLNNNVTNFFQNFSFFTYFQFLQSDLTKLFLSFSETPIRKNQDLFGKNKGNILIYLDEIKMKFFDISNFLFNFNKTFQNFIENKKIFLKIFSNFLNLIGSCLNFVTKINLDFLNEKDETFTYLDLIRKNKIDFFNPEDEEIKEKCNSIRENVSDYLKNFNFYLKILFNLKNNFIEMIEREIFLFKDQKDFRDLLDKIKTISEDICDKSGIFELKNSKILKDLLNDINFGVKDYDQNKNLDNIRKFI